MNPTVTILLFWCLVGGILGAVIAQSKNRAPWEGALLGVLLGLIGVLIVALLPKVSDAPTAGSTGEAVGGPRRKRTATGDERPAMAQARLDEAAEAVNRGAYPKAFEPMYDESYEADRRGDVEALELLLDLAKRIEAAPDAHQTIRRDAQEFAARVEQVLLKYPDLTEPEETKPQENSVEEPSQSAATTERGASALDIVKERYARGEITREEFQQISSDLGAA